MLNKNFVFNLVNFANYKEILTCNNNIVKHIGELHHLIANK